MAVATAAEHSHSRREWLGNSGDVKRIKKGEMEVEVVLESLGVFQDAKIVFKETTTQPWQDPFKTGGGLAMS